MEDQSVKLHIVYTASDWLHAIRFHKRFKRLYVMEKLVATVGLVQGCLVLWTLYRPDLGSFVFIDFWDWLQLLFPFSVSIFLGFDIATWLGIKTRYWRERKQGPKIHEFLFDDTGAEYKTGDPVTVQVRLDWNEFRKVRESKQVFLLILKDSGFWAIPKRYLIESDQLDMFQKIVAEKIP